MKKVPPYDSSVLRSMLGHTLDEARRLEELSYSLCRVDVECSKDSLLLIQIVDALMTAVRCSQSMRSF